MPAKQPKAKKPTPAHNLAPARAEFEKWADNNWAPMLNADLDHAVSDVKRAFTRLHNVCVEMQRLGLFDE